MKLTIEFSVQADDGTLTRKVLKELELDIDLKKLRREIDADTDLHAAPYLYELEDKTLVTLYKVLKRLAG